MTKHLDKMIEAAHAGAKKWLIGRLGAELPVTFTIEFKNRKPAILVAPWRDEAEKIAFLDTLAFMMKLTRNDIVGYSVVSEAWMTIQHHEPRPDDLPPSKSDDRKEVVFACASDGDTKRFRSWDIERGPDAVITALVPRADISDDNLGGRMADLLEARS